MRRFGYRAAVLMGSCLFGAGALLFLPAAQLGQYHGFLRRVVRHRQRLRVPRNLRESADRRHGPARKPPTSA